MNQYEVDNVVTTRAAYTDADDAPVDPEVVSVIVKDPNDAETTYVYGTDGELVKDDIGEYHISLLRSIVGKWSDRWKCSGDMFASKTQCFEMTEGCAA